MHYYFPGMVVGFILLQTAIIAPTIFKLTFIFAIACYAMIPATNRAKDEGNEKRFNLLHKSSVYLTIAVLIMNVGFLFV